MTTALATACGTIILRAQVDYDLPVTDAYISTRTIDTEKPIGVIDGVHGVSATGSANYSIPLELPPGTNGNDAYAGLGL